MLFKHKRHNLFPSCPLLTPYTPALLTLDAKFTFYFSFPYTSNDFLTKTSQSISFTPSSNTIYACAPYIGRTLPLFVHTPPSRTHQNYTPIRTVYTTPHLLTFSTTRTHSALFYRIFLILFCFNS